MRSSISMAMQEVKESNKMSLIPALIGSATYVMSPEFLGILPDGISHKLLAVSILLGLFFPSLRRR